MNNNGKFKQFSMFNLKLASNNVLYWENALSYSNELSNFIELVDNFVESYFKISKWTNLKKIINLNNIKKSTGIPILDKRILYISNSFNMGFEMCFDRYCNNKSIDPNKYLLDLDSVVIKKNDKSLTTDLDYESINNVAFFIIAYINDDYKGGELFLSNNLLLKPKAGTVLIIPASEINSYKINENIVGNRYVASTMVYKKEN